MQDMVGVQKIFLRLFTRKYVYQPIEGFKYLTQQQRHTV